MALIEVLRCADCGKLSISVGDTRLTTEDRKEKGHGDRKCSGRWTVAVAAQWAAEPSQPEGK